MRIIGSVYDKDYKRRGKTIIKMPTAGDAAKTSHVCIQKHWDQQKPETCSVQLK
jgi:hypothetical protein